MAERTSQSNPLSGFSVLVVDDNQDTVDLLVLVLSRYGADVVGATSAAEAIAALDHTCPNVIVSDINMPIEDGYELLRQVRARAPECGGRVPVVAFTAFTGREEREQIIRAGFQEFIGKPAEPDQVVRVVTQLLGLR